MSEIDFVREIKTARGLNNILTEQNQCTCLFSSIRLVVSAQTYAIFIYFFVDLGGYLNSEHTVYCVSLVSCQKKRNKAKTKTLKNLKDLLERIPVMIYDDTDKQGRVP